MGGKMDDSFFDNLVNESESDCLKFKEGEYPFDGASDEEKSELLEDILALANAWRRTDAYILIGVMAVKGAQNKVVGISKQPDLAAIQQFVNINVQKPVTFSYLPYDCNGKQVGIIQIPVQDRPFYLSQNFGKLRKNVVYIRRGNSTVEAAPDEVAKMGASGSGGYWSQIPMLEIGFADPKSRRLYGNQVEITSKVLFIPDPIPDFFAYPKPFGLNTGISGIPNRNFYRELYKFYDFHLLLKPIRLRLKNSGQVTAYNAHVEIILNADDIVLADECDFPDRPRQRVKITDNISFPAIEKSKSDVTINHHKRTWSISVHYGNIQPKAEDGLNNIVFIGSRKTQTLQVEAVIFADNIPAPIRQPLYIEFLAEGQSQTLEELNSNYDEFIKM